MDVRNLREQINRERAGRRRPRSYSIQVRAAVVEHVRSHGMRGGRITTLASALGISRYTIMAWVKRSGRQSGSAFRRITTQEPPAQATLMVPGGYQLRGDAASLVAVLRALTS